MTASSLFDSDESRAPDLTTDNTPTVDHTQTSSYSTTSSLYRKYRPSSFDAEEMVGQDRVVRTIQNAIALNRVAHAYLFSGPRGTGKTTTARLLAKGVNCLDSDPRRRPCNACLNCRSINEGSCPEIIEIDAASNRGIDDIRDLRERIRYAPAQLPSKVYIIDEAHQITGAAANAFLKTLEEPPAHSRFILATTDPEELLATIVSRCQRYDFRRISVDDMTRRLRTVADLEQIRVTEEALRFIARHATGSLRDALGLLEQLALLTNVARAEGNDQGQIDVADVLGTLGLSHNDRIEGLVEALAKRDPGRALSIVQEVIDDGGDPRQLNRQLLGYVRHLLLHRSGGGSNADPRAQGLAARFSLIELASIARRFGEIDFKIKHSPFPQLPLEVALVEATAPSTDAATVSVGAAQPKPESESAPTSRPTSLRDRVRNPTAIRSTTPIQPLSPLPKDDDLLPEPTSITPLRPVPRPPPPTPSPQESKSETPSMDVEQIAALWPRVRGDVKALNRRVEALLSEVDPVAISGNHITLAVPYPFHRDKLNSDDVREIVAGVLSRLLGRQISIICMLRGEMAGTGLSGSGQGTVHESEYSSAPVTSVTPNGDESIRSRLLAAKNIFDAEEIDAAEIMAAMEDAEGG